MFWMLLNDDLKQESKLIRGCKSKLIDDDYRAYDYRDYDYRDQDYKDYWFQRT